jgi:WD40 repeat protein
MVCKAITFHSFIIGLKNGKLIKVTIREIKQPNKLTKKEEIKVTYKVSFKNYIQGHKGSINMIEFDKNNGIILTGGDDNKLCIRKLYDFELLTCIKIKSKFIITMAKISPKNFLYILCYNKNKKKESYIIFGYTLSGLKFAKSNYSYYTNIEFTSNGNIITLINEEKVGILEAHNLNLMSKDDTNKDFEKIQKNLYKSQWFQYHDFLKYYGYERKTLSYLSIEESKKNKTTYFKTSKATDIPSFN